MNIKNFIKILLTQYFVFFTFFSISCNKNNKTTVKDNTVVQSIFSEPFSNIKIPKTIYKIYAQKDTILLYKTGTKINIPKNAFLDKEGKPINGEITLSYREFTNAFDIYLGGIPMQYDSAGTEQVFETAGMIEINANYQGQEVFPNPENRIKVEMASYQPSNQYNVYGLDTVTGKWNYLGKDIVETESYKQSISTLPQVPPPPKKAGQYSFKISDGTGNYPELSIYKNVYFEPINNERCGFHSTEIKVKDIGNGIYEVRFIIDAYGLHEERICKCYLAFKEGADYDNAMIVYQNKYKSLIEKREKMKKEIENEWKKYFDIKQKYEDLGVLDLFYINQVKNLSGEEKITRTLELSGFGFINCDLPTSYPQGASLIAKYSDKNGKELKLKNVVLVEKGRNAIFRYEKIIKFNPSKDNILWGITSDNKLAFLKEDDFKKITQTNGEFTFVMNVYEKKLETYEDICNVLFNPN